MNKDFIKIQNPSRENMKIITTFSKLSNDLKCLSVPDLSLLALAYEFIVKEGNLPLLRKEPVQYDIQDLTKNSTITVDEQIIEKTENENNDGFIEVKSKKQKKKDNKYNFDNDEGEWITLDNIDEKLHPKAKIAENESIISISKPKEKKEPTHYEKMLETPIKVYLTTADFTMQNVALKIGIPVMSIDGMRIRKIKNYILKCYSCHRFNYDTTQQFCENCGYPTLMKIGYSTGLDGKIKINDKKAEPRLRGTQYNLPMPTVSKKGVIYILSEDTIPKKKKEFDIDANLDKILDNYKDYKDLNPNKEGGINNNTSKNYVWGYPKKNPNTSKKYYSKKQKK